MKTVSVKLDDYVLSLLNSEAKKRKVTRMEIIRSSIIKFLLSTSDAEDLEYIKNHKNDKLVGFDKVFK